MFLPVKGFATVIRAILHSLFCFCYINITKSSHIIGTQKYLSKGSRVVVVTIFIEEFDISHYVLGRRHLKA